MTHKPKRTWRDRYVPRASPKTIAQRERFRAGCAVLEQQAMGKPGARFTQGEIARATGVSQQRIHELEHLALKKIRKITGFSYIELNRLLNP